MPKRVIANNPILLSDYPDPDVIRVGDTFYMISTTMHMMPGAVILRSYNLVNWEIASYVYQTLDGTNAQKLSDLCERKMTDSEENHTAQRQEKVAEDGSADGLPGEVAKDGSSSDRRKTEMALYHGIYGRGMWAATLRYHKERFIVCFVANDTGKTYIYESEKEEGPWRRHTLEGFYHDSSLLFDDDGRVYIVYGNRQIYITELNEDLTAPKKDGIHTMILEDSDKYRLGLEGSHFYKINGRYYLFCIHWGKDEYARRTEACFIADHVEGPYLGGDVLDDDMGFRNMGVAQGGVVDTPDGEMYAILFQDHGAMGRIPVLVPVRLEGKKPVFGVNGRVPKQIEVMDYRPGYHYAPLYEDDDFNREELKKVWQWNHESDPSAWSVKVRPGFLRITPKDVRMNVVQAVNTLTQRTYGNVSEAEVCVDGSNMKYGDFAGISAFMSEYCFLALHRTENGYRVVQMKRSIPTDGAEQWMGGEDYHPGIICDSCKETENTAQVKLKITCRFLQDTDTAECAYYSEGQWVRFGEVIPLRFTLDHFMGCRYALSCFATKEAGGYADFSTFRMKVKD